MKLETEIEQVNHFCEVAMLNKQHDPWVSRREREQFYCNVLITQCPYKDWWFSDFVGMVVFCRLVLFTNKNTGNSYIYRVEPVRLTGTQIHRGRDLPVDCISIV